MSHSRPYSDRKDQTTLGSSDDEIAIADILRFLKSTYKTIIIFGVAGIFLAIAYLAITPNQYEAVSQIAMAQIAAVNNKNDDDNILGINIEEPSLLILRLSSPASINTQIMSACGINEGMNSADALSKFIKLKIPKGVANVVELKTFGKSPKAASICSQTIFELIKTTQEQIIAPYIAEAKIKLDDDILRLEKARDLVAKADKSGAAMGATYLSTRDEIRFLLDEIRALNNVVIRNQARATRLITPIYASDTPIAPKKEAALVAGLFGGVFLGLLIAFFRWAIAGINSEAGEVLR